MFKSEFDTLDFRKNLFYRNNLLVTNATCRKGFLLTTLTHFALVYDTSKHMKKRSTSYGVRKFFSQGEKFFNLILYKCSKWTQKVSIFSTSKEALSPSPSLEMTLPELHRGPRARPWPLDQFQH